MTTVRSNMQKLIEEAQPLVYSLASRIFRNVPPTVELDDLVAYGELGLTEAARDYDPTSGVKFTTFAYHRVRGAIYDGISKMSWTSRSRYRRMRFAQQANELLAEEANGEASGSLESEAKWLSDLTSKMGIVYFASQGEDGKSIRDSAIEDADAPSAVSIVAQREIIERLRELIQQLPRIEQRLLLAIYFEGNTLQEASDRLGVSKSWASRLHANALEQLARSFRRIGVGDARG